MSTEAIESLTDFPQPIASAITALGDANRRRIVGELGRAECLSYTKLKEMIPIRKGTLNHHLSILMGAGIIRNFSKPDAKDGFRSYYSVAPLGERIVQGIFSSFDAPQVQLLAGAAMAVYSQSYSDYVIPTSGSFAIGYTEGSWTSNSGILADERNPEVYLSTSGAASDSSAKSLEKMIMVVPPRVKSR